MSPECSNFVPINRIDINGFILRSCGNILLTNVKYAQDGICMIGNNSLFMAQVYLITVFYYTTLLVGGNVL